jgi:uncharacterized protein HemX
VTAPVRATPPANAAPHPAIPVPPQPRLQKAPATAPPPQASASATAVPSTSAPSTPAPPASVQPSPPPAGSSPHALDLSTNTRGPGATLLLVPMVIVLALGVFGVVLAAGYRGRRTH